MSRAAAARLLSSAAFFLVAYGILFAYADNYFCSASRGQARPIVSAKLALACTLWDGFACALGLFASRLADRRCSLRIFASTIVSGAGFASIPFWIYQGYGHFLFENTWADVSCIFTEGSGMMFPLIVTPLLAETTLIREWTVGKLL
jgi:hypothetical protein